MLNCEAFGFSLYAVVARLRQHGCGGMVIFQPNMKLLSFQTKSSNLVQVQCAITAPA